MPTETASMRVYKALRQKIINNEYSPSESLIESSLAAEYGISRNTLKKVFMMLEQEGLVTVEVNKSVRVRSFSRQEVLDFLEFRQELEGYIIRLAVPHFTEEDIRELETILNQMYEFKLQNRLVEYSAHNQRFHNKIFDCCPNRLAVEVTQNLKNQMRKYNTRTILVPGRAEKSFAEHREILSAIKERSPERAEKAMRYHLANVRREFDENFDLLN